MKYNGPFDQTNPAAGYVNGNPATNTPGSIPCAEGLEYPQREIVAAITAANLVPTNGDLTQLAQAIQALAGSKSTTVLDGRNITGSTFRIFATPGTTNWTVPAGVTKVHARGWGAGGGGAGGAMAAGAAGGYFEDTFAVTPGQVIPVTVGAGGLGTVGSTNNTNPGNPGGTTSFGSLASATGGQGGSTGSTAGGTGSGAAINLPGSGGMDLDGFTTFAVGGSSPFGGGSSPYTGVFPGGGGGASATNSGIGAAGFNGGNGCLILQF